MNQIKLKSYIIGFVSSVLLTLAAFFVTIRPGFFNLGTSGIITAIMGFALIQFVVQALFFLHLGQESKPRWNLVVFFTTLFVILILVTGSIWIMNHLNYNMSPEQMNAYMLKQ